MRIIAGTSRGRRLVAPQDGALRPTSDRAREALFSILTFGDPPLAGSRFLDLFAGTGAVGLEALSRGATDVLAVENDPASVRLIRENAARTAAGPRHRILVRDATRLGLADDAYDITVLDPPYATGLAAPALRALHAGGWLHPHARVVLEQASGDRVPEIEGFVLEDERRYGAGSFAFFRLAGG